MAYQEFLAKYLMGGSALSLAGGSMPVGRRGSSSIESNLIEELSRYYPDFEITKDLSTLIWVFKNINTGKSFGFDHLELLSKNELFKERIEESRKLEKTLLVKDIMPELKKATPEEIKEKLKIKKKKKDEHFSDGMSLSSQQWTFGQDFERMALQRQMAEQLSRQQRGFLSGTF